jgi:hypothetical protein
MKKVVTWSGWAIAVILAVVLFRDLCCSSSSAEIVVGQVRQDRILGPLPLSMQTNPSLLMAHANAYRTNEGWISASNGQIFAGLPGLDADAGRIWSAPYTLPSYRHEVTVWLGQGGGVSYQYQLLEHWSVGGMLLYTCDQVSGLAGVGYRW